MNIAQKHGFKAAFNYSDVNDHGRLYCNTKEQFTCRLGTPHFEPGLIRTDLGIIVQPLDKVSLEIMFVWFNLNPWELTNEVQL
jgi:hypothetical protein